MKKLWIIMGILLFFFLSCELNEQNTGLLDNNDGLLSRGLLYQNEVWVITTSIANKPGAYKNGHTAVVVGSDLNNFGWYIFSIERPSSPYVKAGTILWTKKLPLLARIFGSSTGDKKSCLYYEWLPTSSDMLDYIAQNAPGVDNKPHYRGNGYDRIAVLKNMTYNKVVSFKNALKNTPPTKYNLINNNCSSFVTKAIESHLGIECENRVIEIPNNVFDDLYDNNHFYIWKDATR
jgi:hypothetical protein